MPAELKPFAATLRCVIYSPSEVDAMLAADQLRSACMELLDEEDGDEVVLTQVTGLSSNLEPTETLVIFAKARNALIRTRIKECYLQAKEFDQIIHILRHRGETEGYIPPYDHTQFMDIAEAILTRNEEPA